MGFFVKNNRRNTKMYVTEVHLPMMCIYVRQFDTLQASNESAAEKSVKPRTLAITEARSAKSLEQEKNLRCGTVEFNMSDLSYGIYYLHVYDGVNKTPVMQQKIY